MTPSGSKAKLESDFYGSTQREAVKGWKWRKNGGFGKWKEGPRENLKKVFFFFPFSIGLEEKDVWRRLG